MANDFHVMMHSIQEITKDLGFGPMGQVQRFVDSQLAKGMDKYVPFDTGSLKNSVQKSHFGSGKLIYDTPYAKYQYQHGRDNKLRGALWNERFAAREGRHFVSLVQNYVRKIK